MQKSKWGWGTDTEKKESLVINEKKEKSPVRLFDKYFRLKNLMKFIEILHKK